MVLMLFSNPKAGTPLMAQSPSIGVDLPLKFLVWQDGSGKSSSPSTAQTTWPTRYCRDTASRRCRSY
jgi:uncharacterized protein (DUF302 family)